MRRGQWHSTLAAEAELATQEVDDLDRAAKDDAALAKRWIAEIQTAEKAQAKWVERAKKIEKIYADERDTRSDRGRKFNILWSNVETLRPAVYMQTPKARAVRRYRDKDPEARFGALMIERSVETSCELYDFDHTMDQAVRDRLVVGRGQAWVFYVPSIVGDEQDAALAYEDVQADYICWQDFLHSVSRTWGEVWWVGRWFHKSRAELKTWMRERGLDEKKAATVAMDVSPEGDKTDEGLKDERARARILEVWNKRDGEVLYVAVGSGVNAILGRTPPSVKFRDFFPCPRPMLATTTAKSLIPTPDYALYQDQAEELNRVTERIGVLQKALKVVGVYASESTELAQMLEGSDNKMIPVANWAMFSEGGGAKNKLEFFPVEVVAKVLEGLYIIREQAKQTLYEVSGIGDILRGSTDPDETATAQGIKAKWGSLRVRRIQKDVQRFAADIMRLKAEVITEQFSPQSVMAMAGVDQDLLSKYVPEAPAPPPPQLPPELQQAAQQNPAIQQQLQAQQQQAAQQAQAAATKKFITDVFAMLKDDTARNFRIDVETDSTLEPDQEEEKQTAVEFVTAISAFLKEAGPMMMTGGPEVADMLGETLLFVVRRFGHNVDALEKKIEAVVEAAKQPKEAPPDPEVAIKQKAEETRAKEVEGKLALENKRIEEVEKPKLGIEADKAAKESAHKDREHSIRERETEATIANEGERIGMERENTKLKRREVMGAEAVEDEEATRDGKPRVADALMALMEEMKRPVRVVRDEAGRAAGLE